MNKQIFEETFLQENHEKYENLIIKASKTLEKKISIIENLEKTNKLSESELLRKNKEILELKCDLMEKIQEIKILSQKNLNFELSIIKSRENSSERVRNSANKKKDLMEKLKKKYKKAKGKIQKLLNENQGLQLEIQKRIQENSSKENDIQELKKDLREIMKDNLYKKANFEEKTPLIQEIQQKNELLNEKNRILEEKEKKIKEKIKENEEFKEKNVRISEEILNLKKNLKGFEEFRSLKSLSSSIKINNFEESNDFLKVYSKLFQNFNKCIDLDRIYENFSKSFEFFDKIFKESEKFESFSISHIDFLKKTEEILLKTEKFDKIIHENQQNCELIDFYRISLEKIQQKIKENSNLFSEKIKLLSSIIFKQENLLNDVIAKNQDLRNHYAKLSMISSKTPDLQQKISICEVKILNYKEILEKKTLEIEENEKNFRVMKAKAQEFEILYNSLKIEYDQYRENIMQKFDFFKKSDFLKSDKQKKSWDLPLVRKKETFLEKNEKFELIFRYFNAKIKGYNFKFNKFLTIVPKEQENSQENLVVFEEFSNFISKIAKNNANIYDIVNQIENNIDSLYLENYNIKILLLHSIRNIIGSLVNKEKNQDFNQEINEFFMEIKKIKSSFVDSFDEIPVEEEENKEEKVLDFVKFQRFQFKFQNINNLIVKNIQEIQK